MAVIVREFDSVIFGDCDTKTGVQDGYNLTYLGIPENTNMLSDSSNVYVLYAHTTTPDFNGFERAKITKPSVFELPKLIQVAGVNLPKHSGLSKVEGIVTRRGSLFLNLDEIYKGIDNGNLRHHLEVSRLHFLGSKGLRDSSENYTDFITEQMQKNPDIVNDPRYFHLFEDTPGDRG